MHQHSAVPANPWLPIVAAALALISTHGIGRFVFTPLIPWLVGDGVLSLSQAASIATWNLIGYLAGAMLALFFFQRGWGLKALIGAILINLLLAFAQAFSADYMSLLLLRTWHGITNGVAFVLAPALVLEWLAKHQKAHLSGLMYLGVGVGILSSCLLVDGTGPYLHGHWRWLPTALLSAPLALWSAWYLSRLPISQPRTQRQARAPLWDNASTPLFLAYAGAGLGYILPMTFLPAVAADWQVQMALSPWLLVAIVSLPSIWLWNSVGARVGDKTALLWSYAIQALGVLALLVFPQQALGLWLCAILVGGTFLGSVLLTQRLARSLQPHQGPRLSAALIALYGCAQLLGPWLAKLGLEAGASLASTFICGLIALLWAFVLMLWVPKQPAV